MNECKKHKCETNFKIGDHNKSIEYCPICEKEAQKRLDNLLISMGIETKPNPYMKG